MGTKYQGKYYVITTWQDDDLPRFGRIEDIIVVQDTVYFKVTCTQTLGIDRHFHSFVVKNSSNTEIVSYSELADHQVFNAHTVNQTMYITFQSHIENLS